MQLPLNFQQLSLHGFVASVGDQRAEINGQSNKDINSYQTVAIHISLSTHCKHFVTCKASKCTWLLVQVMCCFTIFFRAYHFCNSPFNSILLLFPEKTKPVLKLPEYLEKNVKVASALKTPNCCTFSQLLVLFKKPLEI